ncbi:MAG: hypothetical protein IJ131_10465, partial [Eggerthellaceae bacterium]|nr:hypothetical protein [Eggerthellaceae bacterium]
MILPKHEGYIFFTLLDLVTVYAHQRLSVVDDNTFFDESAPRGIGEAGQRATLEELWSNVGILDDFVQENPAQLTRGELDIVASWKDAYTNLFFIDRGPDGQLRFLAEKHLFEVCGLSLEIEGMLNSIPAMANATLLPFRDHVVYAMNIIEFPVQMGDGMLDIMRNSYHDAYGAKRFVSTGSDFAKVVPQVKEEALQREAKEMIESLEREQKADEQADDQHKGVLAGMSFDERERVTEEHYLNLDPSDDEEGDFLPSKELEERCCEGPIRTSLADLVSLNGMPDPDKIAEIVDGLSLDDLGIDAHAHPDAKERFDQLKADFAKSDGAQAALDEAINMFTDPDKLFDRLLNLPLFQVVPLRSLAEAGGRLSMAEDDEEGIYDAPYPAPGLCYAFHENGSFEFVMPDEVVPLMQQVDWDEFDRRTSMRIELIRFFNAVVELRGVTPYVGAIEEYAALHPDGFKTAQEIHDELERTIERFGSEIGILDTGDEVYLLHGDLEWLYLDGQGLDPYEDGGIFEGKLDDMLKGLLAQQKGKEPRPVSFDMLGDSSIYHWLATLPALCALRTYLDNHVPDTQDDYEFADNVIMDLQDMLHWGYSNELVEGFFNLLEDNDFIPT